jgi:hypothetical protein
MRELEHELTIDDLEFGSGFDINAAFQEAIQGVATDAELKLDEKVERMEHIIAEGSSELYQDFVDFRMMAAQIEAFCSHDHALNQSFQNSELLSGIRQTNQFDEGHDHTPHTAGKHEDSSDEEEVDPKSGKKKKKKRRSWFGFSY